MIQLRFLDHRKKRKKKCPEMSKKCPEMSKKCPAQWHWRSNLYCLAVHVEPFMLFLFQYVLWPLSCFPLAQRSRRKGETAWLDKEKKKQMMIKVGIPTPKKERTNMGLLNGTCFETCIGLLCICNLTILFV